MRQGAFDHDSQRHPQEFLEPLAPAIVVGFAAAVLGGAVWTLIMAVTGYEVGYAAWALGGLVGFAMSRTTKRRGRLASGAAATLALVGLLIAKIFIGEFVLLDVTVEAVLADEPMMIQAAMNEMEGVHEFPPDVQAEYDAIPVGDTLSDAMWESLVTASTSRLNQYSEEKRVEVAEQFSQAVLTQLGFIGRIVYQVNGYDALWVLFAVSTAWSMMKKKEQEDSLVTEEVSEL